MIFVENIVFTLNIKNFPSSHKILKKFFKYLDKIKLQKIYILQNFSMTENLEIRSEVMCFYLN